MWNIFSFVELWGIRGFHGSTFPTGKILNELPCGKGSCVAGTCGFSISFYAPAIDHLLGERGRPTIVVHTVMIEINQVLVAGILVPGTGSSAVLDKLFQVISKA
jgi:hypothetical protein